MLILLFILLISCISIDTHYSLHQSDISFNSYPLFDCLYAYLIDDGKEIGQRYIRNYHLVPYCRRGEKNENHVLNRSTIAQTFTFAELKKKGVKSHQLLEWYAPIDLVERYEMNGNISEVFHKCVTPWFGSICQYRFEDNSLQPFNEIVRGNFPYSIDISTDNISGTCYPFISHCLSRTWPLCLDWREICDGKIDCITGEDEQWCEQLQMSQCPEDQYRCYYGGQCIPLNFLKDNKLSIDCLDGSDEQDQYSIYDSFVNVQCFNIPTFRCQERIGRYPRTFQCGDGQYVHHFLLPVRKRTCANRRDIEYSRAILTSLGYISDHQCRDALLCAIYSNRTSERDLDEIDPPHNEGFERYIDKIWDGDCEALSTYCTEEWLSIPEYPFLFGYFQMIYLTNRSVSDFKANPIPDFICFDERKCPALRINLTTIDLIDNLICATALDVIGDMHFSDFDYFLTLLGDRTRICLHMGLEESCPDGSYFHCSQSLKCIPWHDVRNGHGDCYYFEDEYVDTCQMNDSKRFSCPSDLTMCLEAVTVGDGMEECPSGEDELYIYTEDLLKIIPFSVLCNRYENYEILRFTSGETDETNCHLWPCNNPNTRCDGIWHCSNGADELNCSYSTCSVNEHQCIDEWSKLSYCLPIVHLFDQYYNDSIFFSLARQLYFYNETENLDNNFLPWSGTQCDTHDLSDLETSSQRKEVCSHLTVPFLWLWKSNVHWLENNENFCNLQFGELLLNKNTNQFFVVSHLGNFPLVTTNYSAPVMLGSEEIGEQMGADGKGSSSPCHRGIALLTSTNLQTKVCLCPPNYFGDQCQWQNQRISLTLQFIWRSTASTDLIFQAMIMLVDEHGHTSSYFEQITYIPSRDCDTKFNIYLLHPDRPKNLTKNYSIRIDLFDRRKLIHWASWFLEIPFSFLPVNRIATRLLIPEIHQTNSCSLSCGEHGKCTRYANTNSSFFCRCEQGYTGLRCDVKYPCNCANNSLCLAPSICVCPLYTFGRYCYLKHSICQSGRNPCLNNGLCIPNDHRISLKGFTCFCTDDYSGDRCQNPNNRIDIQLDDTIATERSLVLLHFVTAFVNAEHQRTTFLKKIPFSQPTLTLYTSQPFHIVFVQIPNGHYYLAVLREVYIPSEHILTQIQSDQLCSSINQLNHTLMNETYLYRAKFYPLICRQNLHLRCFYDNELMCVCDLDRFSNCFQFNHSTNYDCQGYNQCENGGQCFQNNETCPTKSTCVCPDCYHGSRCQFSTKGFLLSLDPILGYHIKPHVAFDQQPLIIKISVAINTVMLVLGLISSTLSLITFRPKKSRQLGSGNYLLASSLTSLLMIIALTLKFWDLILSQMSVITNRMWLIISCKSLDYLLKVFLASSEWLTACVAIERMISVNTGVNFNKMKSKKYSKWVIVGVLILTTLTLLQDPLCRQLIDDSDVDEQRIWCFVQYSLSVRYYNTFITLFHFLIPFSIHVITALRIIKKVAHRRSIVQPEQPYQTHFQQEFHRHQHLLFAPSMLILLSLPRLILSFLKGCMRSAREPWFYLIGYFVSFIPSTLIFVVFVLPSKHYKREFIDIYTRTIRRLRRI